MGVSLERVQNKFACIIGELCNEPVVLSKFAIWLDLRLAEYKAKGAISLDDFGENPDPSWLKGHEKEDQNSIRASTPPTQNQNVTSWDLSTIKFPFAGGGQFAQTEPMLNESITYEKIDDVSVKQEIEENDVEIIPQWPENSGGIKSNKRPSADKNLNSGPSGEKIQRHSGNSGSPLGLDPNNQSLVSIIAKSNDISPINKRLNQISNSVTTNLNAADPETILPIKEDDSRSLVHYDPFTVASYNPSMPSTTTTDFSRAAQPFQPFSSSTGGEIVLAQDQTEVLVNMTGNPTCPICQKTFVSMGSLRRHTQVHFPNSKRFNCTYCVMRFRRLEHLRSHMKSQHGHLVKALPWDKRRYKQDLAVHRLSVGHGNSKQLSLPAPGSDWEQFSHAGLVSNSMTATTTMSTNHFIPVLNTEETIRNRPSLDTASSQKLPLPVSDLSSTSISTANIVEVWEPDERPEKRTVQTNSVDADLTTSTADTQQKQTDVDELD